LKTYQDAENFPYPDNICNFPHSTGKLHSWQDLFWLAFSGIHVLGGSCFDLLPLASQIIGLRNFLWKNKGSKTQPFCYDWELIKTLKTSPIRIISAFFAASTISADVGKKRRLLLSRKINAGIRGLVKSKFWKKLALQQDFCYHCTFDKNWLRGEEFF
jgi:hypothetical protein